MVRKGPYARDLGVGAEASLPNVPGIEVLNPSNRPQVLFGHDALAPLLTGRWPEEVRSFKIRARHDGV